MKTKKTPNCALSQTLSLNIPLNKFAEQTISPQLETTIRQLIKIHPLEQQIAHLKELQSYLTPQYQNETEKCIVIDILTYCFLTLNPKHVLKKTLLRILTVQSGPKDIIVAKLSQNISFIMEENIGLRCSDRNSVVSSIGTCFENFSHGLNAISNCLQTVLGFLTKQFHDLVNLSCYNDVQLSLLHNAVRVIVCVLQQCDVHGKIDQYSYALLRDADKVLQAELSFDCKSNIGIILIIAADNLPEMNLNWLVLLQSCLEKQQLDMVNLDNEICVYIGMLNVVSSLDLYKKEINNVPAVELICKRLLQLSECASRNPAEMLQVSRVLVVLFRKLSPESSYESIRTILEYGLCYIWTHLDHYIDTIRHTTKLLLSLCIKIIVARKKEEVDELLDLVMANIKQISSFKSNKYIAITVLSQTIGCELILKEMPDIISNLISHMSDPSITIYVNATYETLMKRHMKETDEETWLKTWIGPLLSRSLADQTKRDHLLAFGFKLNPTLLKSIGWETLMRNNLLGVLFRVIKMSGGMAKWRDLCNLEVVEGAMYHKSDEIRVLVLSLIVDSHKSSEIFTEWEFQFLLKYFLYNANIQDPAVRQEIGNLYKKMLLRYQESLNLLHRQNETNAEYYIEFLNNFRQLLFTNLFPGACYSRRVMVLELLTAGWNIFTTNGCKQDVQDETKLLKYCLNDSYEGNKKLSKSLLKNFAEKDLHMMPITEYIKEATSIRPAECISAAYKIELALEFNSTTYEGIKILLQNLNEQLATAKINFLQAASTAPLYGVLFCIRHLIEQKNISTLNASESPEWKQLIATLIETCFDLSAVISPIVNNSSPEGHFPEEVNSDSNADSTVTAQMILICAWRTAKEVSLLLGEIALQGNVDENGLVAEEQLLDMGQHFIGVLTETKHRGAFEQAYIGFNKLCMRLWRCSTSLTLKNLPKIWLEEIMNAVEGMESKLESKLCATRRSAGVPFMIQVLITSELGTGRCENFQNCMKRLLRIIKTSENIESRTHSLNIIRALYRHNQLGELVSPYVEDGIIVAISGFTSTSWSERNSSTLLFSSLMIRIFGVQRTKDSELPSIDNCLSARVFFLRYPALHKFLLNQLRVVHKSALYPTLLLLARLYPCSIEEDTYLQEYLPFVIKCLKSDAFKTRQLAARAALPIIRHKTKQQAMFLICELMDVTIDRNYCHGVLVLLLKLLTTKNFLKKLRYVDVGAVVSHTAWILTEGCSMVATLYIQFVVRLSTLYSKSTMNDNIWPVLDRVLNGIEIKSTYYCAAQYLKLHILSNLVFPLNAVNVIGVLEDNIKKSAPLESKIFALNVVNYLNNGAEHPLYATNEIEWEEFEYNYVASLDKALRIQILDELNDNSNLLENFIAEFPFDKSHQDDYLVASFLFLSCYPILTIKIFGPPQAAVNKCLTALTPDNDVVNAAILTTISAVLILHADEIIDYTVLLDALRNFVEPHHNLACRLVVANLLQNVSWPDVLNDPLQMCSIYKLKMFLHEDEDKIVRDKISCDVMAQKSRQRLLEDCAKNIPSPYNIVVLLLWTLNSKTSEDGQLFQTDEWNDYSEEFILTKMALAQMKRCLIDCTYKHRLIYDVFAIIFNENLLQIDANSLECLKCFVDNVLLHYVDNSTNGFPVVELNDVNSFTEDYLNGLNELSCVQKHKILYCIESILVL